MTTPPPTPQPTNPTEILSAQLKVQESTFRLALQARQESLQRLDDLLKAQNEQGAQLAHLSKNEPGNNYLLIALVSFSLALLAACGWSVAYINQTVIGNEQEALWNYLNGQSYGLGLGAQELLLVIITRFLIGFSITFGSISFVLLAIEFINKKLTKLMMLMIVIVLCSISALAMLGPTINNTLDTINNPPSPAPTLFIPTPMPTGIPRETPQFEWNTPVP